MEELKRELRVLKEHICMHEEEVRVYSDSEG